MNQEKLKQLQAQVRIGGKGTARRKKKVVHRTATTDDKKLQSSLKKLSVNNIPGIEEVNMIKDDGTVIHFNNPKVQASLAANTFAVTGHAENKQITEMLPGILNQLGAESLTHLKRLASNVTGGGAANMEGGIEDDDDDEVPDLVENFDEPSKNEAATTDAIADITEATNAVVDITETTEPEAVEAAPVVDKIEESSVPDLVENFDEPSKNEAATTDAIADITEATNAVVDITETTEPEAVEAAPVEAAPVEAAPVEAAPVEAAPVEAAPVEAAPVVAAPVVDKIEESSPEKATDAQIDGEPPKEE